MSEVWISVNSKNEITSVVERLNSYFKSQKSDPNGVPARFISILDIDFVQNIIGEVNNIELKVKINSDQGNWIHDLIIREFKTITLLEAELARYNELERRCANFENISPSPLLLIDNKHKFLVYEYRTGKRLSELNISDELKDFLIGRIFAMIQGEYSNRLDDTNVRNILNYMVDTLPFTDEEKDSVTMLLEPHFLTMTHCLGGYVSNTLFDPENIEFIQLNDINPSSITENKALTLTIPMQQPESEIVDRMADIASYFIKRTALEFNQTGNVNKSKQSILKFFEGYNSVSKQIGTPELQALYPHGITLDLQMLLVYWIMKYTEIQSDGINSWNKDCVRFTYFILLNKPFLIF